MTYGQTDAASPAPQAGVRATACPHDCPSTCALEVEITEDGRLGKVRGAKDNSYTDGVICAKVARYAERANHPDRLLYPLRRVGAKGEGRFERIGWDEALDIVAENFLRIEQQHGAEAVWPYFYAGTMGLVMRDGIERLRHVKKYSRQHSTICSSTSTTAYIAGCGRLMGVDPREMAKSDVIVIWGTNAVHTQVNLMAHAIKARKNNGARIVVIDTYRHETAEKADMFLCLKPGTDAALAAAVMHILFRDDLADWDYMSRYSDDPEGLAAHLRERTPEWAAAITGLNVEKIEAFARLVGTHKRSYFRLGYGFTRGRNGALSMHAALSIPAVTGAWQVEGGGAFHSNGDIFRWDRTLIKGLDRLDPSVRLLDQTRIGPILTGSRVDLGDGPAVHGMLIQNTNPVAVAPEQLRVREGFAREDLFVCVHEQFMTETAAMADIVLPATMFTEHDDIYQGGGHQHILLGPKVIEAPGECRSNHDVICALAKRLGAEHPGFEMSAREIIDATLKASGWPGVETLERSRWFDVQPPFRAAHFLDGFAHEDGKYHFRPDWRDPLNLHGPAKISGETDAPPFPDYWPVVEEANETHPFRLVTAPARNFLNTSFTETSSSLKKEGRPTLMIHPEDAAALGIGEGDALEVANDRGSVRLHARLFDGVCRGVVIAEGIWPNRRFDGGRGINVLTSADPAFPIGGSVFHDCAVSVSALGVA